jgi:hypothetical protein
MLGSPTKALLKAAFKPLIIRPLLHRQPVAALLTFRRTMSDVHTVASEVSTRSTEMASTVVEADSANLVMRVDDIRASISARRTTLPGALALRELLA